MINLHACTHQSWLAMRNIFLIKKCQHIKIKFLLQHKNNNVFWVCIDAKKMSWGGVYSLCSIKCREGGQSSLHDRMNKVQRGGGVILKGIKREGVLYYIEELVLNVDYLNINLNFHGSTLNSLQMGELCRKRGILQFRDSIFYRIGNHQVIGESFVKERNKNYNKLDLLIDIFICKL